MSISPAIPPLPAGHPEPRSPQEALGTAAALAIIASLLAADALLGSGPQVAGLLGCPPFLAALFASPRKTAAVAAITVMASIYVSGGVTSSVQIVSIAFVVLAGATAVVGAHLRESSASELVTMGHIADIAQLAVLRELPVQVGPATVAVRYTSAATRARVGGDVYEVVPVDDGLRAVVGDVRGNGLAAVQMAGALVGAFRGADHDHLSLEQVVTAMERTFQRMRPSEEDFATVVLVELADDGALVVLSCGHPAPCVLAGTAAAPTVRRVDPPRPRPPLGFAPSPARAHDRLLPGEQLLLFTDGATDVRHLDGRWFDLERAARGAVGLSPSAGIERVEGELRRFTDHHVTDDVTLLLIGLPHPSPRLV